MYDVYVFSDLDSWVWDDDELPVERDLDYEAEQDNDNYERQECGDL